MRSNVVFITLDVKMYFDVVTMNGLDSVGYLVNADLF